MNLTKQFFKYVSQNIFGLLGTSCYILADTYFIAQAAGTDGVTLLNRKTRPLPYKRSSCAQRPAGVY